MNTIFVLLSPLWLSWKNDFRRGGNQWGRRLFLLGLALAFWCGTFFVIRRVLIYFQSVYELGPALAYQLLLIILLTFLWMVLFFSLPIFVAYGSVFGGGMPFYLWVLVIVPLFLTIPASLGILITHLLVYCLPARRIRDILIFIGIFAFVGIYFLFRFSQPERLVQPESFGNFIQFLAAMETPSSPFLPSSWSAEILAGSLFNRPVEQGFFYALLASYALFFPLVTSWVSGAVYLSGWSKAQESRQGRRKTEWLDWALDWITRPFPSVLRAIMLKDIKTFLRDTTQ